MYKIKPKTVRIDFRNPLAQNLVFALPFINGKTQFDYPRQNSTNDFGTLPAFIVGPYGPCPNFNNDTGLPIGNRADFQNNQGTAACWFKTTSASLQYAVPFSKNGAWGIYNNFGILKAWDYTPGGGFINSGINIADGKWHSVVFSYSTVVGCVLYLDGIQVATKTFAIRDQFTQAQVGQEAGADSFIGAVDLPMLWNRVLTPNEVRMYHTDPIQVFYKPKPVAGKLSNKLTGSAPIAFTVTGQLSELFGAATADADSTGIMGDMIGTGMAMAAATGDMIEIAQAGGDGSAFASASGNLMRSYQPDGYINLIPPPNRIAPKFMLWYLANIQIYLDYLNFTSVFIQAFFIQQAVGKQLDIIGTILGVSRIVTFVPTLETDSPTLSDSNYRIVLLAKIMQNQWRGTKQEVYNFWSQFFPDKPLIIKDNQDMSMTVQVVGMAEGIQLDLVNNGYIVPKPAGVRINYNFPNRTYFGFGPETANIKGFGRGYWASGV